jgi:hypothetical protein
MAVGETPVSDENYETTVSSSAFSISLQSIFLTAKVNKKSSHQIESYNLSHLINLSSLFTTLE